MGEQEGASPHPRGRPPSSAQPRPSRPGAPGGAGARSAERSEGHPCRPRRGGWQRRPVRPPARTSPTASGCAQAGSGARASGRAPDSWSLISLQAATTLWCRAADVGRPVLVGVGPRGLHRLPAPGVPLVPGGGVRRLRRALGHLALEPAGEVGVEGVGPLLHGDAAEPARLRLGRPLAQAPELVDGRHLFHPPGSVVRPVAVRRLLALLLPPQPLQQPWHIRGAAPGGHGHRVRPGGSERGCGVRPRLHSLHLLA